MSEKLCPGCPGDPNETCCKPELSVQLWRQQQSTQQATPGPVGEPIYQYQRGDGSWIDQTKTSHDYNVKNRQATVRVVYTHPAPGVPEVEPNEMESKWCWWLGDGEWFHIADTESEAHGEAQCRIDDDCDPGQTHQYSVARVQHPLDALGMDWLALHVAQSIAENVCCWCDDNTGAEEPSIMLSPDDSKALGVMVATFLRQRVGVDWWTADQKTITVHTYVSGSNNDPTLAAAQAKEANPEDLAAAGVMLMGRRDE